jgi:sodium/proline symporter
VAEKQVRSGAQSDSHIDMSLSHPTAITFVVYIVLMLGIGLAASRFTKNLSDYILGGRSLGAFVTAMSAGASDMSGWLLMGLPGALFAAGASEAWIALGLIVGAWFNWRVVAGRLRVYTELCGNALTLPDYFSARFEDQRRVLRVTAALVILVFFTIYCASGMVAGARLFEQTFGLSYGQALIYGAAATILYVCIGGFLAVSWTDTVQASLMIFALLLAPIMVLTDLGGLNSAWSMIATLDAQAQATAREALAAGQPTVAMRLYLEPFGGMGVIGFVSLMAWGLGYMGQPHILARFMAAKDFATLKNARRIGMTWMVLCLAGAMATGFLAIAYFSAHPEHAAPVLANRETVFITLAQVLFNPWMAGVLLSAILAAVMSTLSCQLLVCASALTQDFYKPFFRPTASESELVVFGRVTVLLIAVIALLLASDPTNRVLGMVGYAWAGFGAAFGPVVLFSVLWKGMNHTGALAGMVTGALTVLLWHNGSWFGGSGPLFGVYELLPGFAFASVAIWLGSRLGAPASAHMQARFEAMRAGCV